MEESQSLPFHHCHFHKLWATLNRIYALVHFLALVAIFYYRGAYFFNKNDPNYHMLPFLPWFLVFVAELLFSFLWILKQPVYWWPVTRTVFPERLPEDEDLPGIDVFICTADPNKEPTFGVMNTVISAMALDYPADKLSVYLSDDGGASVTLEGIKEAWAFATWWLPFCKRYNVKTICPKAYFQEPEEASQSMEFIEDKEMIKEKYEVFKERVQNKIGRGDTYGEVMKTADLGNHSALIQVINEKFVKDDVGTSNPDHTTVMPLLVYAAREKRPSYPHNFKAGALNVLVRVSSTLSNSPYILVLDCDMYCNDSTSARQVMCFYHDPKVSPSLGWVQYPHKFHNISESDIYDSEMKTTWPILYPGSDGLQGPLLSGSNFYIKREALSGMTIDDGNNIQELKDYFGVSSEYIKSLNESYKPHPFNAKKLSSVLLQETQLLASCTYEKGTKWGEKVGFRYGSVVEDVLTGCCLQSQGWKSFYLNPARPQFKGIATTNLNESSIQGTRWSMGLLEIGLSKHFPLIHSPSRMQLLNKMFCSWVTLFPLEFFPVLCFATIPPLCFLHAIPLYPKVSDPLFIAFAFVFISSRAKKLCEVYISGGSIRTWFNEQRMWMIKSMTSCTYGSLDFVMMKLGLRDASFIPTNKAGDDDNTKFYKLGKYDFRASNMFIIPLVTGVTLNLVCIVGGVIRMVGFRNCDAMFAQMLFSMYALVMSFPVLEGMVLRKDDGRVPSSITLLSLVVSSVLLSLRYPII